MGLTVVSASLLYPQPPEAPQVITSGFVPTSGFSVNSFEARKFNGVCSMAIDLAVLTAIIRGAGPPWNIADTLAGTLPAGFRPTRTIAALYSTGFADGEADITAAGNISLRTTNSYDIEVGDVVRMSAAWVL
ncbi:hypothetical protein ACFYWP_01765 [Actinacidiphila glaucinigra]|uniref:hypothetical protein n=1 Tax=Actinacidiphila glaucinigra TaxID=235986 RepID=UPI0036C94A0A